MTATKRRRTSTRIQSQSKKPAYQAFVSDDAELDGNASSSSLSSLASIPSSSSLPEIEDENSTGGRPGMKRKKKKNSTTETTTTTSRANRPKVKKQQGQHNALFSRLFAWDNAAADIPSCVLPERAHSAMYHQPLLLDAQVGQPARKALLAWFDSVSETRRMPWRKAWIDPGALRDDDPGALREALMRRAYEVWISEIMLQQTRVAAVIDYWKRWMARWPTIQELAAAREEEVLAAWSGLGYYSRATRIHEAARVAVSDARMAGLLPASAGELEARMPGVGRYTAGAISSIVFGRAEAMVDGNVLRVLSRQMGIYGDVKRDRGVIDAVWAAAGAIVRATAALDGDGDGDWGDGGRARGGGGVVLDAEGIAVSDRPGRWGQGLMELGSTVCTPKPNCEACPITGTCRAYLEGEAAAAAGKDKARGRSSRSATDSTSMIDIEDACTLCEGFEESMEGEDADELEDEMDDKVAVTGKGKKKEAKTTTRRQATLAAFAFTRQAGAKEAEEQQGAKETSSSRAKAQMAAIVEHARRFPVKGVKKAVREEATLVCAVRRRSDGRYLIVRRPLKGLLAGLWELPSQLLEASSSSSSSCTTGTTAAAKKRRAELARAYVSSLFGEDESERMGHVGELGSVPWLFSHIRLTMHVHLFELDDDEGKDLEGFLEGKGMEQRVGRPARWVDDAGADAESMGTGMRKCWALAAAHGV